MSQRVPVTVHLPGILAEAVGRVRVRIEAATLRQALDELFAEIPALRFHLCEDSGRFRTHVLCFHNDTNTRTLASLDVPLEEGDDITFLQAVSGG